MGDLQTLKVGIDDEMHARIERIARRRDEAVEALCREALRQYADREENHVRFQDAALASWATYRESGLHATADEVDDWLRQLEAGDGATPPPCHG